jgi:hypothetical protein
LEGFNQGLAGLLTFETAKILGGDDDDFVAPMHGHMLWALAAHLSHQFAESRFGVL